MSSTANVSSSSTANAYQPQPGNPGKFATLAKNFQAIGAALQSGNVSGAQSALATFQQNLPSNAQASPNQPFGKNSQANTDYQNLTTALKSGDAATAQQAYSSLQNDFKSAEATQGAHRGHHHHRSESASETNTSSTTDTAEATGSSEASGTSAATEDGGGLLNATA